MKYITAIIFILVLFFASNVGAQERKIDYAGEIIVDSDLDGLTDKGEQQIYGTNPGNPDSDGDGYLDGAEVLSGTDAVDKAAYPGSVDFGGITSVVAKETPWAWYLTRAAGIVGFIFLWLTIFLGLSIRNPLLKKIVEPIYSFDFHCFTAAAAVFWALVHGTSLLLDHIMSFSIKDVAIPYFSQSELVNTNFMALGIMAFYAMVIMTITSYLRSHMNHRLWRALHFLNPLAFAFVVVHGYYIGTDMKNIYVRGLYLGSAALLALIYFSSLVFAIINKIKQRT